MLHRSGGAGGGAAAHAAQHFAQQKGRCSFLHRTKRLESRRFCAYPRPTRNRYRGLWPPVSSGGMRRQRKTSRGDQKYPNRRLTIRARAPTSRSRTGRDGEEGRGLHRPGRQDREDITHPVLTQIIFELENKEGQNMLPIPFLRQLIAFYGDQMQMIVPSFLEQSMIAFSKEQERLREQMKSTFGKTPMDMMKLSAPMKAIEEQTRRNIEISRTPCAVSRLPPAGSGPRRAEPGRKEEAKATEKGRRTVELKGRSQPCSASSTDVVGREAARYRLAGSLRRPSPAGMNGRDNAGVRSREAVLVCARAARSLHLAIVLRGNSRPRRCGAAAGTAPAGRRCRR